jgi:hypothetical protein
MIWARFLVLSRLALIGQTRGRYYLGEPVLLTQHKRILTRRAPRETGDPFALAAQQLQLTL